MNLFRDDSNRLSIFLDYQDEIDCAESDCDGVTITLTEEMEYAISMTLSAYLKTESEDTNE